MSVLVIISLWGTLLTSLLQVSGTTIRLVNGPNSLSGRVEVYHGGWGTVCDDNFGTAEANVVCRMLGLKLYVPHAYSQAHYGQGTYPIKMDGFACVGNETDIANCPFNGWGDNDCGHSEDAGASCDEIKLRLQGGNSSTEGRLQVQKADGVWRTVSSNGFTIQDAQKFCKLMFGTSADTVYTENHSSGNMYRLDTRCWRSKTCYSDPFTSYSQSTQDTDVGIKCSHTDIRLVNGSKDTEGRVEVFHDGVWGSICDDHFTTQDAKSVCGSLGLDLSNGHYSAVHGGAFGTGVGPFWLSNLGCTGTEFDLTLCSGNNWSFHNCPNGNAAAVRCPYTPIRLTDGVGPWEGRLEIQQGGRWGSVCGHGFDQKDAGVVCRLLGYNHSSSNITGPCIMWTPFPHHATSSYVATSTINTYRDVEAEVLPNNYFGGNVPSAVADNLGCTGSEIDISLCLVNGWQHTGCSSSQAVGVRCQTKTVRLADGSHPHEGRVEVKVNGTWGTICDDNWDDLDATAVCRMLLQYPMDKHVSGTAISGGVFGPGRGHVVLSDVHCNGSEDDLFTCQLGSSRRVNCDHSRDAGVSCSLPQNITLISSSGRNNDNEGNVEISDFLGTYGVCDDGWDINDARAICRSLGYWVTSPTAYENDWFSHHPSLVYNLFPLCTGDEVDLSFCSSKNELGKTTCSTSDTAGLRCTPVDIGYGNVKLVDGENPGSGNLLVNYNGVRGSICAEDWTDSDTDVVCKTLRYRHTKNATHTSTVKTSAPVLIGDLQCFGNESDIGLCKADFSKTSCGGDIVRIDCSDGVSARVNGTSPLGGRIELKKDGVWRVVCSNGVNANAGRAICAMMGYTETSPIVTSETYTHNRLEPVVFPPDMCAGYEIHLGQCSSPLQLTDQCISNSVARISCFDCHHTYNTTTGTVQSDHYPADYNNNTDCIYVVNPPATHSAYKLQIKDLALADSGDYIDIRESPDGPILGTFSSGNTFPTLAGRSFWIRFKTNSAGTAKGFRLEWSPLTVEDAISVNCDPQTWNTVINMTLLRQLYPNVGVSSIYLSKSQCTGTVVDDLLVFDQSYTDCSSTKKVNNENVVYENQLVYPDSIKPFPIIVHAYKWKVNIECDLSRHVTISQQYKPTDAVVTVTNDNSYHHIGGNASYDIHLKFFKDPGFFQEIHGNPISSHLGDKVYVQVSTTTNDPNIKMKLDTCTAKPNINAGQDQTYALIQNGCVVDTSTTILSQGSHQSRFVFNSFEFPSNHDAVYVVCNATFCETVDQSQACRQTCSHRRNVNQNMRLLRSGPHNIDIYKVEQ